MNEHITNPEQTVTVTPPHSDQNEEKTVDQSHEQTTSPTLAQRIQAMNLDEEVAQQLTRLTEAMPDVTPPDEVLATLVRGITHDADVKNADAAGFLRGRNEKIEAVLHPEPQDDDATVTPIFPRYCRRSVWE